MFLMAYKQKYHEAPREQNMLRVRVQLYMEPEVLHPK